MSQIRNTLIRLSTCMAASALLFAGSRAYAPAQTASVRQAYEFRTLQSFAGAADGASPVANLVMDGAGNLYGVTEAGGAYGVGTIFEYSPASNAVTTLYTFVGGYDGEYPIAGLLMDANGNLFGSTEEGGLNGDGTIFEYSPATNTFTQLHSFTGLDGEFPVGTLVMDASGNLCGTTRNGGPSGTGTVFEYTPGASSVTTLHGFSADGPDGGDPYAGLIMDAAGDLYGVTGFGGLPLGAGTIFKYSPSESSFTTLYTFSVDGGGGANPIGGIMMDSSGAIYGTTDNGGVNGNGTIFKYAPATNVLTTLHVFSAFTVDEDNADGANPRAGLVMDGNGNLFGTATAGGANGCGTVFEYSRSSNAFTTLHQFSALGAAYPFVNGDGAVPVAGLTIDSGGNLHGVASEGGVNGLYGTIFTLRAGFHAIPAPIGLHPLGQ